MRGLTQRQREVVEALLAWQRSHAGQAPSLAQLAATLLISRTVAYKHLIAAEKKGAVRRVYGRFVAEGVINDIDITDS